MKLLVTGHQGYIGTVMTRMLTAAGHAVTGLDAGFYRECTFGDGEVAVPELCKDVRDVTLGEDASQVRSGNAPEVLAALRNVTLALLRRAGHTNIAAALRANAWQSHNRAALRVLGLTCP